MTEENKHIPSAEYSEIPEEELVEKREFDVAGRLKKIAFLIVAIISMWLIMKYYVPAPFENKAQNAPAQTPKMTSENASPMIVQPVPTQIEKPPIADILSPIPEQAVESEAPAPTAVEEATPIPGEAAEPTPETADIPAVTTEVTEEPVAPETPALATTETVEPSLTALSAKDKKISELQCLINLETQNVEQIKLALSSCYAVMVNAGVTQRDMYVLKRAVQEDLLVNNLTLKQSFHEAVRKSLLSQNNSGTSQTNWYSSLKQRITGSFTIRKTGWQEGNTIEAIIARAEVFLEQGKIRAALNEVQTLPEKPQAAFDPFSEQARALIALQRVKNTLKGEPETTLNEEDSYAH